MDNNEEKKSLSIDDLIAEYKSELDYIRREVNYIKEDPGSKYNKSIEWLKGYGYAIYQMFQNLRRYYSDGYPEIREATEDEKKEFTIVSKFNATAMDVAINNIYGNKLEEGKEYESKEIPFGIMEYNGEKIPVYTDDPGQQDYCVYHGKIFSGGAYNSFPESEFVSQIDSSELHAALDLEGKDGNGKNEN